jgi:hypothetical protein
MCGIFSLRHETQLSLPAYGYFVRTAAGSRILAGTSAGSGALSQESCHPCPNVDLADYQEIKQGNTESGNAATVRKLQDLANQLRAIVFLRSVPLPASRGLLSKILRLKLLGLPSQFGTLNVLAEL